MIQDRDRENIKPQLSLVELTGSCSTFFIFISAPRGHIYFLRMQAMQKTRYSVKILDKEKYCLILEL